MNNEIIIKLKADGNVSVVFPEEHISKRQLTRILKSLKLEYRRNVRNYRKQIMKLVKTQNEMKGVKNGKDTGTNRTGTEGTRAKPKDSRAVGRNRETKETDSNARNKQTDGNRPTERTGVIKASARS